MASWFQIGVLLFVVGLIAIVAPLAAIYGQSDGNGGLAVGPTYPLEDTWYVTRAQWLANKPDYDDMTPLTEPQNRTLIMHTATVPCTTWDDCKKMVKYIQEIHMTERNFSDIAYNFLVGGDGRVYEGRGWDYVGSHTYSYNLKSLGIGFIGDYRSKRGNVKPTADQIKYMNLILSFGLKNNKLTSNYTILPQCDIKPSGSPGDNLYYEVVTWDRYSREDGNGFQCNWEED